MKTNYAQLSTANQRQQATPAQVKNNAGGYVFRLSPMKQLERFLILGSDTPTYYQNAQALTVENARVVQECFAQFPRDTVDLIINIISNNRAIKIDPIIFSLAIGTLDPVIETRHMVYAAIPIVCKNASQMFMFVDYCDKLNKGWGRGLKNKIAAFYERQNPKGVAALAYQMIKYRQRNGFTHQRLLRLSHPKPGTAECANLYNWNLGKEYDYDMLPDVVKMYIDVNKNEKSFYSDLPWEAYPTERIPWSKLAPTMPYVAMVRNLNKFDLRPLSELENIIVKRLEEEKPQMHPFQIMWAWKTYSQGRGFLGSAIWEVNQRVSRALEHAYYNSFKYVKPSGERFFIAFDISGSMSSAFIRNTNISAIEASMAMALPIVKTEKRVVLKGFSNGAAASTRWGGAGVRNGPKNTWTNKSSGLCDVDIGTSPTLSTAIGNLPSWSGGGTDCSLPMIYAKEMKIDVDKFIIFTDNETWAGQMHPYQALKDYRKASGINAKMIVCGMTSTGFSIADPSDEGMLDIVGCDGNLPQLISSL
jgi:60 kDa SS-A/Ro ribonucleoprotein